MKTKLFFIVAAMLTTISMRGQSFRKGTLLIGISEGSTMARYTTSDVYTHQVIKDVVIKGDRDPLQIEYGISNKWGIALSFGNDIFKINPQRFYKFGPSEDRKVKTSESLIEINYHFINSDKWDIVAFYGIGSFKAELFDNNSNCLKNALLTYEKGKISRGGLKARFYFTKRWAVLGMLSVFNAYAQTDQSKPNDILYNRIQTNVKGTTLEFGLSYKILK